MESMTATNVRKLPRWAWILSFLVLPSGIFIAFGFVRLLSWTRAIALAVISLASVIICAQILSYMDEVHANSLMHDFGNFGCLLIYTVWFFAIYWIGRRAAYWSLAGQRGWRWAGWFAVGLYGLNVVSVLISIALLWVGEA